MYEYTCNYTYSSGQKSHWKIYWGILYLCVPSANVGCSLAHSADILWNTAQIASILNETDAATIATAISCYGWMG